MARDFNGSTERLQKDVAPITGPPLSVSAWFDSDIDPGTPHRTMLSITDKDASGQFYKLYIEGFGDRNVHWESRDVTAGVATSTTFWSVGTWHHALGVEASASDRRVYLDGGGKGTDTTNKTPVGLDHISVGRLGSSSPDNHFDGKLAEVGLWNVALTDDEAVSLASGVSPLRIRPGNLRGHWPIFGTGSPEPDFSPQANHLTLFGTSIADHPSVMPSFSLGMWQPLVGTIVKTLTDTGDPTDSIPKRSVARSLTDTGDPTDSVKRVVSYIRTQTDQGSPTDDISKRDVTRRLTDVGGSTDGLLRSVSRVLMDTGDPTDAMLRVLRRTLNVELAGPVDGLLREVSRVLPTEDPGVIDAVSIAVQYVRIILDAAGPTDSIALRRLTRLLTDAGDPSDALLREVRRTVLDPFTSTDDFLRSVSRILPADDSGLTDRWGEKIIIGKVIVSRLRERTI